MLALCRIPTQQATTCLPLLQATAMGARCSLFAAMPPLLLAAALLLLRPVRPSHSACPPRI